MYPTMMSYPHVLPLCPTHVSYARATALSALSHPRALPTRYRATSAGRSRRRPRRRRCWHCSPPSQMPSSRCAFAPPGNTPATSESAHIQARQPSPATIVAFLRCAFGPPGNAPATPTSAHIQAHQPSPATGLACLRRRLRMTDGEVRRRALSPPTHSQHTATMR